MISVNQHFLMVLNPIHVHSSRNVHQAQLWGITPCISLKFQDMNQSADRAAEPAVIFCKKNGMRINTY